MPDRLEPDAIVMFGATGDLARKMLFPALYRLEQREVIAQRVIGVALDDWSLDGFSEHVSRAIRDGVGRVDEVVERRLLERLGYVSGDYRDPGTYEKLASAGPHRGNCLHYLAIPPSMFETVIDGLDRTRLLTSSRVLVEKPFGRDAKSARELNRVLHRSLDEKAIYRIDHFLGKESVENLLTFRYANPIIDSVWSRHYIDHIQLTMAESFGVEDRGALYESLGVVRDVVQNHLLQVVCLLTMEAPVTAEADSYADERAKILKAIRPIDRGQTIFGQYKGYREADHVSTDSIVPTFVALELAIDTPRWHGVPVLIRAGKGLATTSTEAVVVFRESPPLPFTNQGIVPEANRLVFRLGPSDGVDLLLQTKVPGAETLATTPLAVDYETVFGRIPLAYERVLHDALEGNRSQFAREDSVDQAWRIVSEVCDPGDEPHEYERGSWGPAEASDLPGPDRHWIDPAE